LVADVEVGRKVQLVIDALRDRANGDFDAFQLVVDDPAGNSFVQPLSTKDGALTTTHYERTDADAIALGFRPGEHAPIGDDTKETASKTLEGVDTMLATPSEEREVMTFGVDCPHCRAPGEEQMCVAASFWRGASTVWGVAPPPDPRARHAADVRTPRRWRGVWTSPRRATRPTSSRLRRAQVRREDSVLQGVRHHVLLLRGVRVPQRRGQGRRRRAAQGLPGHIKMCG
jgi:hypothetical protein